MRPLSRRILAVGALVVAVLIPAKAALAFTDVPSTYWDYTQIQYVAPWMSDYGSSSFQPATLEPRSYVARSMVKMFAPTEPIDSTIHFSDLSGTDPMYPYANVATKLGWIPPYPDGTWRPTATFTKSLFDQAVTLALKLQTPLTGLLNIHQANGTKYTVPSRWQNMQLAAYLRLHYNHSDESLDLQSSTLMKRDEVAYSLWRAKTLASWEISGTSIFDTVALPTLDPTNAGQLAQQQLTQYAINQVGYPYIWGGEWNKASPVGYCCGTQPQGGFDCSGFVWWTLKKYEDGYNAAQYRVYPGWSIHDRSSSYMAENAPTHIAFANLAIGNLMFFASDGGPTWQDVDHVGIYVGNNWMMPFDRWRPAAPICRLRLVLRQLRMGARAEGEQQQPRGEHRCHPRWGRRARRRLNLTGPPGPAQARPTTFSTASTIALRLNGRRSSASMDTNASRPVSPFPAMNTMTLRSVNAGSARTCFTTSHPSSFGSSASIISRSYGSSRSMSSPRAPLSASSTSYPASWRRRTGWRRCSGRLSMNRMRFFAMASNCTQPVADPPNLGLTGSRQPT